MDITFSEQDEKDLQEWRKEVPLPNNLKRHKVVMPEIEASTPNITQQVESALDSGNKPVEHQGVRLAPEIVEGAKAAFTATGGNISEVAALYDLTPEVVMKLATQEKWPIYGGGTKAIQSKSQAQLNAISNKLWKRIEKMLDAMDVEKKEKDDIVQHRVHSEYVEPLASRSAAFKTLMDQYMRVMAILEPETFSADGDPSNMHARAARGQAMPGGIEGVNRELANFFSDVVVGVADRLKEREVKEYGQVIHLGQQ